MEPQLVTNFEAESCPIDFDDEKTVAALLQDTMDLVRREFEIRARKLESHVGRVGSHDALVVTEGESSPRTAPAAVPRRRRGVGRHERARSSRASEARAEAGAPSSSSDARALAGVCSASDVP